MCGMTDQSVFHSPSIEDDRHPENAEGLWWVNDECIDCGLCYDNVPETFRLASDMTQPIVHKQPESEAEIVAAQEAQDDCPVAAILSE